MMQVSYMQMTEAYFRMRYPLYSRPYNLNIFGIRSAERGADEWDDTIGVMWHPDGWEAPMIFLAAGTTDPGSHYLRTPQNRNGTAILVPGYYPGMWRPGMHKGQYPALVQANICRVYRDNNRDDRLDMDVQSIEKGLFGINLHRGVAVGQAAKVGLYSAGCQVLRDARDLQVILDLVKKQKEWIGIDTVSYALFDEKEVK